MKGKNAAEQEDARRKEATDAVLPNNYIQGNRNYSTCEQQRQKYTDDDSTSG